MIRRASREKVMDELIRPALDTLRYLWYSYFVKEPHNDRQVRKVCLLEDVIDARGKIAAEGTEVFAIFPPDPSDSEGACYPLYYSGLQLFPDQYQIVLTDRDYQRILKG